jgi:hypothetical protein
LYKRLFFKENLKYYIIVRTGEFIRMNRINISNYGSANRDELRAAFKDVVDISNKIYELSIQIELPDTGYRAKLLECMNKITTFNTSYAEIFNEGGKLPKINQAIIDTELFVTNATNYFNAINEFNNKIFDNTDGESIESKVDNFTTLISSLEKEQIQAIKDFHSLIYSEGGYKQKIESDKTKIEELKTSSEKLHEKIKELNKELLEDKSEEEKDSIRSKILAYKLEVENFIESEVSEVRGFHKEIFGGESEGEGTKYEVANLKSEIEGLKARSEDLLSGLTDESLHDSFSKRAKAYTDEHSNLRRFSSVILVVLSIFYFVILIQGMSDTNINYKNIIYQISLAIPLAMLVWFLNRDQKIAKKLAEEYHHKSSISAAIVGYRKMYKLSHGDKEYMELFECIKDQLNKNPSDSIDKFLLLNSPPEEVIDTACKSLNDASEKLTDKAGKALHLVEEAEEVVESMAEVAKK